MILACIALTLALASASDGMSLPEAVRAENDSLTNILLAERVGLDAVLPDYYGATALMLAAERNDADLTAQLLAAGADPDTRDVNGDTALNWAAYYGHAEVARALLQSGADAFLSGHGNALEIAVRRGFEELSQQIAATMGSLREPEAGENRVREAVLAGDLDALGRALREGSNPDARDELDRPVLHVAARLGDPDVLKALIDAGAGLEAEDLNGFTALMVAAREAHAAAVSTLVEAGASVKHQAASRAMRLTPMHSAASGGDPEIVRVLARAGGEIDAPDSDGVVPMMWALADGRMECVLALMELGADPTIADDKGNSVASIARQYEIKPILDLLEGDPRRQ